MKRSKRIPKSRNAPCHCGSGKRFKHCHGAFKPNREAIVGEADVHDILRKQEASEMLRRRQQGYGRPLISTKLDARRFVVVGNRVVYSQRWAFFTDFLIDNLKEVLGRDWGRTATKLMPDFPVFRWLRRLQEAQSRTGADNRLPSAGFVRAIYRLAYAIYLIEHNDSLPRAMIKRLKHPNTFDAHCYEALVAASFAMAGAKIKGAEDDKGNAPKPEFFATFSDGKRYSVEAKRKAAWRVPYSRANRDFEEELRGWIRGKLYASSKKHLTNPVYWFELSIGSDLSREDAEYLRDLIGAAIEDAEEITVAGQPAQPAYVVVTNNPDFANDDAASDTFHVFQGFRMDDFREGYLDIETAMDQHDKHRAIRRVLECTQEVQQLPATFDGIPNELLDDDGNPISVPQIGERMAYPRQDGSEGIGTIVDMLPDGDKAWVVVSDPVAGNSSIVTMPLTEREAKAAARIGPVIFGKPERKHKNITDPLEFYDRMLEIYADYSRDSLLTQIQGHRDIEKFKALSDADLRVRVSREITKAVNFQSKAKGGRSSPQVTAET